MCMAGTAAGLLQVRCWHLSLHNCRLWGDSFSSRLLLHMSYMSYVKQTTTLSRAATACSVKAVYPDAGVAAMLTYQWTDKSFAVDSLNARRPVSPEDELVVICCPDPFGAEECQRTVRQVAEQDEKAGVMERPVVLFNQRLSRWGLRLVCWLIGRLLHVTTLQATAGYWGNTCCGQLLVCCAAVAGRRGSGAKRREKACMQQHAAPHTCG